jgi:hypothetical protein
VIVEKVEGLPAIPGLFAPAGAVPPAPPPPIVIGKDATVAVKPVGLDNGDIVGAGKLNEFDTLKPPAPPPDPCCLDPAPAPPATTR